jgi:hypothetical protein
MVVEKLQQAPQWNVKNKRQVWPAWSNWSTTMTIGGMVFFSYFSECIEKILFKVLCLALSYHTMPVATNAMVSKKNLKRPDTSTSCDKFKYEHAAETVQLVIRSVYFY